MPALTLIQLLWARGVRFSSMLRGIAHRIAVDQLSVCCPRCPPAVLFHSNRLPSTPDSDSPSRNNPIPKKLSSCSRLIQFARCCRVISPLEKSKTSALDRERKTWTAKSRRGAGAGGRWRGIDTFADGIILNRWIPINYWEKETERLSYLSFRSFPVLYTFYC
jgi:hypothetical protein